MAASKRGFSACGSNNQVGERVRIDPGLFVHGRQAALAFDYSDRTKTKHADVNFAWLGGNGSTLDTYQNHFSTPINPSFLYNPASLGYGGIPGILNYNVLGAMYNQFYLTQQNGQDDWSRNYTVEEKVPLAYAKFNIETTLAGVPLRGNVGVQFVHTNQTSNALQTDGNTLVGTINGGSSYNNVLPSLNLVAEIGERQYLRFGPAKTMARGHIDDEKVATSAGVFKVTDGPPAGQVLWSGSGGNPWLRPYVALGTDLSWEKYFGNASSVSVAVFEKNLLGAQHIVRRQLQDVAAQGRWRTAAPSLCRAS